MNNSTRARDLIISVHIPKTAGTSFKEALSNALGEEALLCDYNHTKEFSELSNRGVKAIELHVEWLHLRSRAEQSKYKSFVEAIPDTVSCVHGHFPASKYLLLNKKRNLIYITWLRDPMDRMLSNYYYWMEQPENVPDALVRKIKQEQWTPEKMFFCPQFRNYQSMWLKGVPTSKFRFIGIVEEYKRCLDILAVELGLDLCRYELNATKQRAASSEYTHMASEFKKFHRKDYELYECAKRKIAKY